MQNQNARQDFNGRKLDEIVDDILREARQMNEAIPEPDGRAVAEGCFQRIQQVLDQAGLAADDLLEVVTERTSQEFAFESGICGVVHMLIG